MRFLFAFPIVGAVTQVLVMIPLDGSRRILTGRLDTESSFS